MTIRQLPIAILMSRSSRYRYLDMLQSLIVNCFQNINTQIRQIIVGVSACVCNMHVLILDTTNAYQPTSLAYNICLCIYIIWNSHRRNNYNNVIVRQKRLAFQEALDMRTIKVWLHLSIWYERLERATTTTTTTNKYWALGNCVELTDTWSSDMD